MNASSEDIKDMLLADSSLGLAFGQDLFIGEEPAKPNECVTIYDTLGLAPDTTMEVSIYERPSVQIRVRSVNYKAGWDLIETLRQSLIQQYQTTWSGTLYTSIRVSSGPAFLERDENSRTIFIVNFDIQRR